MKEMQTGHEKDHPGLTGTRPQTNPGFPHPTKGGNTKRNSKGDHRSSGVETFRGVRGHLRATAREVLDVQVLP